MRLYPNNFDQPGNKTSIDNDTVTLPLSANDATGDTVYYSATGLPAGLSLDENTGIISGIITSGANTSSPYTTVLTADDGSYNASQTITWTVYPDR